MNFLAHLFLSGPPGEIMLGNFIADSVTSRMQGSYSAGIQKGIELHRAIDTFTDQHPVVEQSKARLRERYRKYAPVIVDIFYDHVLAKEWGDFSKTDLRSYADEAYLFLGAHTTSFPARSLGFYRYMQHSDILYNYSRAEGIDRVMQGMARRSNFDSGMEHSSEMLLSHYKEFREEFLIFFPELQQMTHDFLLK
jgi:acyl carrier protein phosphodiesterase